MEPQQAAVLSALALFCAPCLPELSSVNVAQFVSFVCGGVAGVAVML